MLLPAGEGNRFSLDIECPPPEDGPMDVEVGEVAPGVHHARAQHVSWVLLTAGSAVTVVDTGYPGDRQRLLRSVELVGRKPADIEAVVLTHGHPDHIGSGEYLRRTYDVPVWAHQDEAANATGERIEQVSQASLVKQIWKPPVLRWTFDIIRLHATKVERLGDLELCSEGPLAVPAAPVVVHTPGHTSGHVSLHLPERGALLAGDALMTDHALAGTAGPQLLPAFFNTDHERARASLELLRPLAGDVVVPGHGPAFTGTPEQAVALALSHAP